MYIPKYYFQKMIDMVAKSQFKFFDQLIMYVYKYDMGPSFLITQCPRSRKIVHLKGVYE